VKSRSEEEILIENDGLIWNVIKSINKFGAEPSDLYQVGSIGLLKAIRKHDPKKGKLSTIATIAIRNQILNYLKKEKRYNVIKIAVYEKNLNSK
jgi:RNA polymerase sporulation-specific sigma factor